MGGEIGRNDLVSGDPEMALGAITVKEPVLGVELKAGKLHLVPVFRI